LVNLIEEKDYCCFFVYIHKIQISKFFYRKNLLICENKFKIKIDYLEFRDEKKMKLDNFKSKYRLFIAYHINGVRLIDNF